MRYVRGRDFDSVRELAEVLKPGMPHGHTEAYTNLLAFLDKIDTQGFPAVWHAWTHTGVNEIWVFTDGPIRCAIQVLLDGRVDVGPVTLLVTAFTEGHAELVEWLDDFVARADHRLKEGEIVEWQ